MAITTNHPKADIAHRFALGHDRASVEMLSDMTYRLLTTGTHEQIVKLNNRLMTERNGKGGIPLNRRIDADGNIH